MGSQNESATLRTLLIYWSRTENRPKYAILPGVGGNKDTIIELGVRF